MPTDELCDGDLPPAATLSDMPVDDDDLVGLVRSKLQWAFGVSFEDGGIVEQFTSPDGILSAQNLIQKVEQRHINDAVEMAIFLDDTLNAIVESLNSATSTSTESVQSSIQLIIDYLTNARGRCATITQGCSGDDSKLRSIITLCAERIGNYVLLLARGLTPHRNITREAVTSHMDMQLQKNLEMEGLDEDSVKAVIDLCQESNISDPALLDEIFNPLLDRLRSNVLVLAKTSNFTMESEIPIKALRKMLSHRVDGVRPFANLLVSRPDFVPTLKSNLQGREFAATSYLGPFFSLGASGTEDESFCDEHGNSLLSDLNLGKDERRKYFNSNIATRRNWFRAELKTIMHELLANASSRNRTVDFLEMMLRTNRKRTQMRANRDELADNGVAVNFALVMVDLAEKITLDKIQDNYLFHKKCRVDVKEATRLKLDSAAVDEYAKTLDVSYEPKFTTECFYLTLHALGVGVIATIEDQKHLKRELKEIRNAIKDIEERMAKNERLSRHPRFMVQLASLKDALKRLTREYVRNDCLLQDDVLLTKCLRMASEQMAFLLRPIVTDYINIELPEAVPEAFACWPESYLENILDLLIAVNKYKPQLLLNNLGNFHYQLLVIACATHFFNNPFLGARVVEVIFMLCPAVNPRASHFWSTFVRGSFAQTHLFPSLAKFYADVETTGSHTEFYDKFNIRRQIQVVFKCLWDDLSHRNRMMQEAKSTSPAFVRFVNMVINDSTFLLDESLAGLEKIHDVEVLMENEQEWGRLSDEDKETKKRELESAKYQTPTWILFGCETIEMFTTLSNDCPSLFTHCSLGERVATMLMYNAHKLCGPECSKLKVKDGEKRFGWKPKQFLEQLIDLYLSLSSDQFAQDISQDERSYTPDAMQLIIKTIRRINLPVNKIERFQNLAERAAHYYRIKAQSELEVGDDIPDEFVDPIMSSLMLDPVRLPSGQVMDKKNILRHLLSDKSDPFTRMPMTESDLVPDEELKVRIQDWLKTKTGH